MERNPTVGKPSYLISKEWLKKYKQYVFYSEVKRHNKPTKTSDEFHPGPISNDQDLVDDNPKNLKGTGKVEQFEPANVDKYLKHSVSERYHYKVVNEEVWAFLFSKYGGQEIKRYAIPQGTYYTTVEVRLKQVPVVILPVSKLYAGGEELLALETEFNV
jgi:hypothetical protein